MKSSLFSLKNLVITAASLLALAVVVLTGFAYSKSDAAITVTASIKHITEEISASGRVDAPERLDLYFRSTGTLASRTVSIGDAVSKGNVIASQDVEDLEATLAEAHAAVEMSRAKLGRVKAGATVEDRALVETGVVNAETTVQDVHKTQRDVMHDAVTKIDDAITNKGDQLLTNPKSDNPQLSFFIPNTSLKSSIELERVEMRQSLLFWQKKVSEFSADTDILLVGEDAKVFIEDAQQYLMLLAEAVGLAVPGGTLTQTTIDKWKTDISAARLAASSALTALIAGEKSFKSVLGVLETALRQRDIVFASVHELDVELVEAEIRQALAREARAKTDLVAHRIVAPVSGTVVYTDGEVGELVGPSTIIATIFPEHALEVELDVSENDIIKVALDQKALVTLDAFGTHTSWEGRVVHIDPAGTVIGGAVYYRTRVIFENSDNRVRSGMTAEVRITTAIRDAALVVPASALEEVEGVLMVTVVKGSAHEKRPVKTGVRDMHGNVEILEGLREGELVVIGEM